MDGFWKNKDLEKPLIRYRLRRPSRKVSQDGFFFPAEPLDPRAVLILRLIVIGVIAAVASYVFAAWYFTTQVTPEWPNLQINSLRLSQINLNVSAAYLDAKWEIEFTLQNPNSGWIGKYQPSIWLQHAKGTKDHMADKTLWEHVVKPHKSLVVNEKMYSARMVVMDETVKILLNDKRRGVMYVSLHSTVKAMYTMSRTDWDTDPRTIMFNCDFIKLKFSDSGAAVAEDLPKDCIRNFNPNYARDRQPRI